MWQYTWNANGSLKSVKKPSGQTISFEYDALGRRTKKFVKDKTIHYIWSGNVLLHEIFDNGNEQKTATYVYEQGNFVPSAKLVDNESFSIVSDYIGRPIQVYDQNGDRVWSCDYDIYGKLINLQGDKSFIPFRQLGQYEDVETGLYYNRFRYYDCNTGTYISQDPIGLAGGLAFYAYVHDVNGWVDIFGLAGTGGAYMFKLSDGKIYVGKGEISRMKDSIEEHTNKIVEINGEKVKRTILGKAHISTAGDNELGKAVEYKAMANEGALAKNGKNKAYIPKDKLENSIVTGSTAYKGLTNEGRLEADRLAKQLKEKLEKDIKKKHH